MTAFGWDQPALVPVRLLENDGERAAIRGPRGCIHRPRSARVVFRRIDIERWTGGRARLGIERQYLQNAGEELARTLRVRDASAVRRPLWTRVEAVGGDSISAILSHVDRNHILAFINLRGRNQVRAATVLADNIEFVIALLAGLKEDPCAVGVPLDVTVGGATRITGTFSIVRQLQRFATSHGDNPYLPLADVCNVL